MRKLYLLLATCLCLSIASAQYTTNGNASHISGNEYQLTPQNFDQRGSVWNNTSISLANDFILHVELNFGNISETNPTAGAPGFMTGADGIVFAFQSNGTASLGALGEYIGYGGINNSFAVEFDTWQNVTPAQGGQNHADPVADHVGFLSNGNTFHFGANSHGLYPLAVDIENGAWLPATFMWDASAQTLSVTFMGNTYMYTGNIAALIGSSNVYWGFTAATGLGVNDHRVRILQFGVPMACGKKDKKVTVCHIPPGNSGNRHEICVSWNAVPAHLAHGDHLGNCNSGGRMAPTEAAPAELAKVTVYPNPSRGNVSVRISHLDSKAELSIINSRGTVVEKRTVSGDQLLNLDLKKYGVGMYLLKLVNGDDVQTTKVMVQE